MFFRVDGLNFINLNREGLHRKQAITAWNFGNVSAFPLSEGKRRKKLCRGDGSLGRTLKFIKREVVLQGWLN